jgi:hypothetical protein
MDQQSICLFLAMKRLSVQAIYNELVVMLDPYAIGYSTVTAIFVNGTSRNSRRTIAWNQLGFPLIVAPRKGRTFDAEYYRDDILAALTQLQSEGEGRKVVGNADNGKAHTAQKCWTFCEDNGLRLVPHPPHSHDLAPSDVFLFDDVKERLKGMVFPSYEELLDGIGEVVTGIESETLTAAFKHWMERLEWGSKNNGDYYL